MLDGGEVLFIDQYISRRALRVVAEIGARFPLYCTANGKALLAALPPEETERLVPRQMKAHTEFTVTDRVALFRELRSGRSGQRTGLRPRRAHRRCCGRGHVRA